MKVPVRNPNDGARQAAYARAAAERAREKRRRRLGRLEVDDTAIRKALTAYQLLPSVPSIHLRADFIALRESDVPQDPDAPRPGGRAAARAASLAARPPLGKLLATPSNALSTLLSILYVVQAEQSSAKRATSRHNASRDADGPDSWAVLCGRWASAERTRRARIQRDLEVLARLDMVELHGTARRREFEGFGLLREDPSTLSYRSPEASEKTVALPAAFFSQGWHLVLTSAEIGALLTILHATAVTPQSAGERGIAIPTSIRDARYKISSETYDSVHPLHELGLIQLIDPMPTRRNGKVRFQAPSRPSDPTTSDDSERLVPYRFVAGSRRVFDRDALTAVASTLLR